MALYFGWILSFPYFGQVLKSLAQVVGINYDYLTLSFLFSHALGFVIGGIFLKNTKRWKQLMFSSLIVVLTINLAMWFLPAALWILAMALAGIASPFYILGWSCLLATYPAADKVKLYLNFIIRANLMMILLIYLTSVLSPTTLYFASIIPLLIALAVLIFISPGKSAAIKTKIEIKDSPSALYVFILTIFVILLNFTLGFVYTVIYDSFSYMAGNILSLRYYYRFIPYLLPYFVILKLRREVELKYMIYTAVSLTGLGYVSFIFLSSSVYNYYLTISVIQVGYALIALFVWLLIGNLSTRYATPYIFFGYGLFAILVGSFFGGILGKYLLDSGSAAQMVTAFSAIAALFSTLLAIPWLLEKAEEDQTDLAQTFSNALIISDQEYLEEFFRKGGLTVREIGIVQLLLQGHSNKKIAETLFISEDTLKTHLRNIYRKYGVHKKSELLALIASKSFTAT